MKGDLAGLHVRRLIRRSRDRRRAAAFGHFWDDWGDRRRGVGRTPHPPELELAHWWPVDIEAVNDEARSRGWEASPDPEPSKPIRAWVDGDFIYA